MSTLTGKIIVSTRPLIENDLIKSQLETKGAQVLDFPMIRTECVGLTDELKSVFSQLNNYEWIVFTSKNGVISFYELLGKADIDSTLIASKKIAVMGKATGEEVLKRNGNPHLISSGRRTEDLLVEIKRAVKLTDKVLLVLGELAEQKLEKDLNGICMVERINVYRTIDIKNYSNEILNSIAQDKYDIILFTSPSGFRNFHKIAKQNHITTPIKAACIGTTTQAELLKNNCLPLVVSPKSDAESFANEIGFFLNNI
ncbi:MAG: uroporphyrinogen-III synthase [Paludibacter sp.]|nr:uroporphyrinogen-III synthase [Paludibacter sp.]